MYLEPVLEGEVFALEYVTRRCILVFTCHLLEQRINLWKTNRCFIKWIVTMLRCNNSNNYGYT